MSASAPGPKKYGAEPEGASTDGRAEHKGKVGEVKGPALSVPRLRCGG